MIRVVVDDLALVDADALVRPATTTLEPISPALRNLERVAGPRFQEQIRLSRALEIGAATVTAAGDLSAEFVIHAVIRSATEPVSAPGVRLALTGVAQRALDWQFTRVALPPVGSGAGDLVMETTADLTAEVFIPHLKEHAFPADLLIVVGTDEEREIFEARIPGE